MSAESPRKSSRQGAHVVSPQPVSDRSIIESVAGFINEVVPQAYYTSSPLGEGKEAITWARFEYGDINDPALYPDSADDRNGSPPLLLVLGYGSGVQVWAIPASGEATEVLSWRQGVVRTLRILPTPGADTVIPDAFSHKRPLVAMCDCAGGPSPQFCSLSFISLRSGDQVKSIKFKNPVSDVLANRRSVVVTFHERIAVFDASTLEDRLTVTTCYPCPGPNPNPVALGSRWLAYSERRLMPARRSSGGSEGEGVQSYTATVLHAAKSLGKGLRELGETVASSLTGGGTGMGMQRGVCGPMTGQQGANMMGGNADVIQPGIVTILDAQGSLSSAREDTRPSDSIIGGNSSSDNVIAHFMAHSDPIIAMAFDPSGMLLLTADKRGHDFHVFRIHPHPGGPSLAAVHHLYVLHRGDTTAKVQDIAFAADSRWVAISTLRGTTHVFPITPYGGPVGIRTHATPHVVNRLSRFHRSAGLTADGRNSPVPTSVSETVLTPPSMPYPNPRLPPYSHPTVISPLAQIRQPTTHTLLSASASASLNPASQQPYHRNPSMRTLGRTQSSSDEGLPGGGIPLRVTACFASPRAWLIGSPTVPRETSTKAHKRAVDSLFVMACHGNLIEYDLEPRHAAGIPKEKICDDTAIELDVQPKAQWMLLRPPHSSELQPPLSPSNPLMVLPDRLPTPSSCESRQDDSDSDERWLSQVEIVTHAGPHRRLWMGPQFTFKTYNNSGVSGVPLSLLEMEAVEVGIGSGSRPARSNPVNMPLSSGSRPVVPVLIESGSGSSYEQSPRLLEAYGTDGADSDGSAGPGETQLREDLADAMMESPGIPTRETGRRVVVQIRQGARLGKKNTNPIQKVVNPVGTVITVTLPSEEVGTSDFSTSAPRNYESSAEEEGAVKWPTAVKSLDSSKCEKDSHIQDESPLRGCIGNESVSCLSAAKPASSSQNLISQSKPAVGDDHLESHEPVIKCEVREGSNRTQKKCKGNAQGLSGKRYSSKISEEEKDYEKNISAESTEHITIGKSDCTDRSVPWRTEELGSGHVSLPANIKEKECVSKKREGSDSKSKSQKSLASKSHKNDLGETTINEEVKCKSNIESEVKIFKTKAQFLPKVKDSSTGYKSKSSVNKSLIANEASVQDCEIKGESSKFEEDTFFEASSKLDELKCTGSQVSKQSTKHKMTSLKNTDEENFGSSFRDSRSSLGKECTYSESLQENPAREISHSTENDHKISVSELNVSKSDVPNISDDKEVIKMLQEVNITSDIDSNKHEAIKLSLRKKHKEIPDIKPVLSEGNKDSVTTSSFETYKKKLDELDSLVAAVPELETQASFTLLHGRFSEHHFGFEQKSSHDTVEISDFDFSMCGSLSEKPMQKSDNVQSVKSVLEEKPVAEMKEDIEEKSGYKCKEISGGGNQDAHVVQSTYDEDYVLPQKSWSSIVSSSNRNKSLKKEVSSSPRSEARLFTFEESGPSSQRSWSNVASAVPKSASSLVRNETPSDINSCSEFECEKGPINTDDSDDGEDKVTLDSNKSQSSDRTSGSDMVTASESLSNITSESGAATANKEEDSSLLNEESNGNDEDLLDNGGAASITASLGSSKKNRKTKKKRR